MLENFYAPYDATVIKRLEAAGAVMSAKPISTNSPWLVDGKFVIRATENPWDTPRFPVAVPAVAAAALAAVLAAARWARTRRFDPQPAGSNGWLAFNLRMDVSPYGLVASRRRWTRSARLAGQWKMSPRS